MCGISGIFHFDGSHAERAVLEAMNARIVHRGPDDSGAYIRNGVGLAMRRLSIVDLATGAQPLSNEDGSIWIVYNGEIYNHASLRTGLLARGHRYRTRSDTETIVHLYEEHGFDCLRHLRGMFAFAIWDAARQLLFCARDRLGIKPFYYCVAGRRLAFASEIKAVIEASTVGARFESAALPEYLAFGYLSGVRTMFAGINKLPPGHWMAVSADGTIRMERYWDLPVPSQERAGDSKDYVRRYRELLEQAVESHLMSDVPLGVLLSGGLDSSVIAAIMQKKLRTPVRTFSVGFTDGQASELAMARRVARQLGTAHHEITVSPDQFFDALPRLIWHEDEPITWPSSVALNFVCRLARKHVKVVLTGEGSDETLAGYTRYPWTVWNQQFYRAYRAVFPADARRWVAGRAVVAPMLGARLRRFLGHTFLGRDGDSLASFYFDNFYSAIPPAEHGSLLRQPGPESAHAAALAIWERSSGDMLSRLLYTDMHSYLVELLMKQDSMSMACSIESRVPYLDHELVEFAARIPARLKIRGLSGKCILKEAAADLLPRDVIHQRKRGFPTPWRAWLNQGYLDRAAGIMLDPRATERGLFRREAVQTLIDEHRAGAIDHSDRIWRLLNLELWHRIYIDGDPEYHSTPTPGDLAAGAFTAAAAPARLATTTARQEEL